MQRFFVILFQSINFILSNLSGGLLVIPDRACQLGRFVGSEQLTFVPFYLALSFAWKAYSKERYYEEEYGRKMSILGMLPSLPTHAGSKHDDLAHEAIMSVLKNSETGEIAEPKVDLKELKEILKAAGGTGKN